VTRADDAPGAHIEVLAVANDFFGGNVSVTGLLTGADLVTAISGSEADVFLVPDIVVNADGLLLDDIAVAELPARTGKDVRLLSCDARGLLAALRALAQVPPESHKE
jgi:NifB/MoaA-like Fe-S oxidoreductase